MGRFRIRNWPALFGSTFVVLSGVWLTAAAVLSAQVWLGSRLDDLSLWVKLYLMLTVGTSLVSFFLYASDKRRAIVGRQRIRERTLHVLALLGGWPGAALAQRVFFHKTQKLIFRLKYWVIVGLHVLLVLPAVLRVVF